MKKLALLFILTAFATASHASYTLFEADQVRPLALSPDGTRLFVLNTPDDRLEIFTVQSDGLVFESSVPVGMRPVAVAARSNTEVWVVNHLSDSVSIVNVGAAARVTSTLLVGDEPRDIVFDGYDRAYIATAHRGQNTSTPDGDFQTAGIGRADVWVFDAAAPNGDDPDVLGGSPSTIVNLFGDRPRSLAVSADGNTVYAAVFRSGNRTTVLNEGLVCNGGASSASCNIQGGTVPGGLPAPNTNHQGLTNPEVGLIVKFDQQSGEWRDELDRNWNDAVRFNLPDLDVFTLTASDSGVAETGSVSDVGTILFNMVVNPASGKLYVSNTEANNRVRFEGPGTYAGPFKPADEPATVRGNLHKARITVVEGTAVSPRHLNKHIDYEASPVPDTVKQNSLATPNAMVVSNDGSTLYVAAFGSQKVGIFKTEELEQNTFTPNAETHITLSGGGPSGLALDDANNRLYVLTRFDNSVAAIDLNTKSEVFRRSLHNSEPAEVIQGRPLLYDAQFTSSNGEASCSSCHMYGDMDDLAWDLGDPDLDLEVNPNPFPIIGTNNPVFHPMKGPMTTQSLRGMADHGPMHWRGDRTDGENGNALDEAAAFATFNGAFEGLLGREEGPLSDEDMTAFTNFALRLTYPPNPVRRLDNSLRPNELSGRNNYFQTPGPDLIASCNGCHVLNPASGFFGGDGGSSVEGETQEFKVPHLRNQYQKVGMFGMPDVPFIIGGDNDHKGDQIRGYGYLHDGSIDSVDRFLSATVFQNGFNLFFADPLQARLDLDAFMMVFDSNIAPIVGQQITLNSTNAEVVDPRIDLLLARADAGEADVIVKATVAGLQRGALYLTGGNFQTDIASDPALTTEQVRTLATTPGQELTFLAVPPGAGIRAGIDRDLDGVLDANDICPDVADAAQTDTDADGIGDACDVCILEANTNQRDTNGDGFGNACDPDLDNSGAVNFVDVAQWTPFFNTATTGDADFNGDGLANFVDFALFAEYFLAAPGPSAVVE
ncbi:MAG: thrombospondin type 3 repeat-containing protein [Gammaproteobacteria bacterium]